METPTQTQKPWVDLGYMNGWYNGTPPQYEEHAKKQQEDLANGREHPMRGETVGRCVIQTWCDACRLTWKVDSSD